MNKEFIPYNIQIHGLEDKEHVFYFEGDDSFFNVFGQEIIEGGHFKAKVNLEKTSNHIRLALDLHSSLRLMCDRSLEEFTEEFDSKETYIYKWGEEHKEISDEMEIIPHGTPQINIAQLLYDYIMLQVPMKNLHPKYRKGEDLKQEEDLLIYTEEKTEEKEKSKEIDPRWAALINLKNKN